MPVHGITAKIQINFKGKFLKSAKKILQSAIVISMLFCSKIAYAAIDIPFTVNLSENVIVTGTPRVALNVGGTTRYATYTSGSGTSSLIFTYTMTIGDVDLDGVTLISPLELNGGTLKDLNGNDASLTFTVPNTSNVRANYPSLGMDFVADADGRYTLNGTVYNDLASFLTAAGGTYTRATTATYFNSSGLVQTAAAGVPRFDYDPITLTAKGMLFEESRTNYALNSAGLVGWTNVASGTPAPVVNTYSGARPDGSIGTIYRLTWSAAPTVPLSYSFIYFISTAFPQSTGDAVGSIFLKLVSGGPDIGLSVQSSTVPPNSGGKYISSIVTATPSWTRASTSGLPTGTNAGNWAIVIGFDGRIATQLNKSPIVIDVWGAQLELGSFPTSYIPTAAAAVTRNNDVLSIPTGSWYNQSAGTFFNEISWVSSTGTNFPMFFRVDDTTNANRWNAFYNQTGTATGADGFNTTVIQGSWTNPAATSGTVRVAGAQSLNNANTSFNGTLKTLDTSWSPPTVTRLIQDGGNANKSIKTIKYYPVRITDTQLQLLSQ
jgi:hypothetical protein